MRRLGIVVFALLILTGFAQAGWTLMHLTPRYNSHRATLASAKPIYPPLIRIEANQGDPITFDIVGPAQQATGGACGPHPRFVNLAGDPTIKVDQGGDRVSTRGVTMRVHGTRVAVRIARDAVVSTGSEKTVVTYAEQCHGGGRVRELLHNVIVTVRPFGTTDSSPESGSGAAA